MTPEEIKDLIAAKIAGQGTMVDVGGGLATILNEIVDKIGGGSGNVIEVDWDFNTWDYDSGSYSRIFDSLEEAGLSQFNEGSTLCLTVANVDAFTKKNYVRIVKKETSGDDSFNYIDWTLNVIDDVLDINNNWLVVLISEKLDKTTGENLGVAVEITIPSMN